MVNTFLVCADFNKAAAALDSRRLGKQRVEAMQIINILLEAKRLGKIYHINTNTITGHIEVFTRCKSDGTCKKIGFYKHPAVLAWVGHVSGLAVYTNACIDEWVRRGYNNSMAKYTVRNATYPWWVKCRVIHMSHRAALLRKEIARAEPHWYVNIPWVASVKQTTWYTRGYVWVANLTPDQLTTARKRTLTSREITSITEEPRQ